MGKQREVHLHARATLSKKSFCACCFPFWCGPWRTVPGWCGFSTAAAPPRRGQNNTSKRHEGVKVVCPAFSPSLMWLLALTPVREAVGRKSVPEVLGLTEGAWVSECWEEWVVTLFFFLLHSLSTKWVLMLLLNPSLIFGTVIRVSKQM